MKLTKKLAILGIIGSLTIGQSMSALATTTYAVGIPVVTASSNNQTYTYYVQTSITASSASYLTSTQYMEYNNRGSSETCKTDKQTFDSSVRKTNYNPQSAFSGQMGDHKVYMKAYCEGYYRTSKNGTLYYIDTISTTKIPSRG